MNIIFMRKKSLALTLMLAFSCILGGNLMGQKNLPYSYGFENNNLAGEGWTMYNTVSYSTGIKSSSFAYNSNYCFGFCSNSGYNPQYLISPLLKNSSGEAIATGITIDFYYKGASKTMKFKVGYSTSDTPTSGTIDDNFVWADEVSTTSTSYTQYNHNFEKPISGNIKYIAIRFDLNNQPNSYYNYFDDINIDPLASCPKPTLSSTVTTTSSTATITWTPSSGSQTLFDIYYSEDSDTPAEETTPTVSNTNGSTYTITGLNSGTTYYVWLRGNCGTALDPDISGGWTSSVSFTTEHTISTPYRCGFEGLSNIGRPLPPYWSRPTETSTDYPYAYNYSTYAHTGNYSLYFYGNASSTAQIGVLPELSTSLNGKKLSFHAKTGNSNNENNLIIGYMTNASDASTFTAVTTLTITKTSSSHTINFSSYSGDPRYIAIKSGQNGYYSLYIDDIIVYGDETVQTSNITSDIDLGNIVVPQNMSISAAVTASSITMGGILTIKSGGILTCNNIDTDADNLVIEDGGQLICNTSIPATLQKSISAATAKSGEGWYAVSSSVHTGSNDYISAQNVTNMTNGTYDLYRFNETINESLPWENYKASGSHYHFNLDNGRGYLYRNSAAKTLNFIGNTNTGEISYTVTNSGGVLAGFNLIGNPYSHDIYKGAGTAIPNGTDFLRTGFYYMDPTTGKWTTGTDNSTAIKPNEAIFVQTDANGNITMTNTNASSSAKANNDNIMFKVANSQYSDEAYAWFDKGRGLNKINHRNAEVPMLYINQDGENYAIATMSDDTKTFSLNLKAMTTGKYTLSYKTKGEFSYLHVIDRFTGEDVDMLLEGEYSFVASPNDSDARFIVRLEYTSNYDDTDSSVFAYQNGNDIIVSGEGELQIFDLMGRKVSTHQINGVETINVNTQGVYIFKLNEKTQKIVVR